MQNSNVHPSVKTYLGCLLALAAPAVVGCPSTNTVGGADGGSDAGAIMLDIDAFVPEGSDTGPVIPPDAFVPPPVCGNSRLEAGEQCDDGNMTDGDGCSAICEAEIG